MKQTSTLILLLLSFTCRAQYFPNRHFTVNDGLPSNTIYDILQDRNGFMWIGTPNGVARFDGRTFKKYSLQDGLSDNEVLGLYQDSKGRIWFSTFNGIPSFYHNDTIYNPSNCKLLDFEPGNNFIVSLFEDKDNNIWIRTNTIQIIIHPDGTYSRDEKDAGVYSFDIRGEVFTMSTDTIINHQSKQRFPLPDYKYSYELAPLIRAFAYGTNEVIIKRNPNSLMLFDGNGFTPLFDIPYIERNKIYYITADRNKNIFVSQAWGGLRAFRMENGKYVQYANLLPDQEISPVYQDRNGDYWMGSLMNGLYLFQKDFASNYTLNEKNGLVGKDINRILPLNDSIVAIGIPGHITMMNSRTNKIVNTITLSEITKTRGIAVDQQNNIWIGSDRHIYRVPYADMFQPGNHITPASEMNIASKCVKSDAPNSVALSASHYMLYVTHTNSGTRVDTILLGRSFANAVRGETIVFAHVDGLFRYDPTHALQQLEKVPMNVIRNTLDMEFADDTHVVMATNGFGLVVADIETGRTFMYNSFSERTTVNDIFIDGEAIWCATNTGIYHFTMRNERITMNSHLSVADGLFSNDVRSVCISNNRIFAGTSEGLQVFPIDIAVHAQPPSVYFNEIVYNNKLQYEKERPVFRDATNAIVFRFSPIHFINTQSIIYAYRLEGLEQDWTETTDEVVKYADLPSGNYTFSVKTKLENSAWSEPIVYHFQVRIPFWESRFFKYILAILTVSIFIIIMLLRRNYKSRAAKHSLAMNIRMTDLENKSLQALMNPHFIYNALNSIQNFINKNDIDNSNLYLSKFSRLVRLNMDALSKSFVTLEEEIERLQLYLQVEKLRLGEKLNFELKLDEDIYPEEMMIPSMIIQPIAENAIWHGIMPKSSPGLVVIAFEKQDEYSIQCIITDDGVGMQKSAANKPALHQSKGMRITEERLKLLSEKYKKRFRIDYESQTGAGYATRVVIEFPMLTRAEV